MAKADRNYSTKNKRGKRCKFCGTFQKIQLLLSNLKEFNKLYDLL